MKKLSIREEGNSRRTSCIWMYFSILLSLIFFAPALGGGQKLKVILDTDLGDDIDDAWALAFVISHSDFDPVGITVTHGDTASRAKLACKMLYLAGREKIPVAMGRQTPHHFKSYQFHWAEDFVAIRPQETSAAEFIVQNARRFPGEIALIAVGPLENVADALKMEPELGRLLSRVVLMSGCIYGTAEKPEPVPEYNVYASIADSQRVYAAGLPMTIVPLDSTTHVRLEEFEREQVRQHDSPLTNALETLYRLWLESPSSRMTLHDQLAVAETAMPRTFFMKQVIEPLSVDDRGFTRIDRDRGKPVSICLEPKRDEFMNFYISELTSQKLDKVP